MEGPFPGFHRESVDAIMVIVLFMIGLGAVFAATMGLIYYSPLTLASLGCGAVWLLGVWIAYAGVFAWTHPWE